MAVSNPQRDYGGMEEELRRLSEAVKREEQREAEAQRKAEEKQRAATKDR